MLIRAGRRRKTGIKDGARTRTIVGDDDGHPQTGSLIEHFRKGQRQAHATVRGGVARQMASMKRDAIPSEPLHVRHGRIVVFVGIVLLMLLQNGKNASWRLMSLRARRDG